MNRSFTPRRLQQQTIREDLYRDPDRMIREENERYEAEVRAVAARLVETMPGRCLVLLSGPSAAGKTTTAHKLEQQLRACGREAYTVSLDNFYRGYGKAPRLPDGSYDYEAVEALDLPLLEMCMQELVHNGCTRLPVFDFLHHAPKPERTELCIPENAVVVFEGIHALNPVLHRHLPEGHLFKIFINVMSAVYDGEESLLAQRELRLARRLLRDVRFRNSSPQNTLDMWRQVVRGEDLYLFPYADTADAVFDTMHAYEPAMLGAELLPLLRDYPADDRYAVTVQQLVRALAVFEPLSVEHLPPEALLREFIG